MNKEKETVGDILWLTVQGWLTILGALSLLVEYGVGKTRIPFTYDLALGYSFVFIAFALICGALNMFPWFREIDEKISMNNRKRERS